ncbi:hypothetical protein Aazo_1667 ['Nostoc azollae' 0708]|jgi:hypothetical protein|uniref:Uncharacterized protein n=1 Tax=Nostoc azollae (strain 0708) TaxID=551115 RepID=D7E533_NOSA0|nr:hypothetical protein Aazo_1667 ['Nostoc azollae' 0708]
MFAQNCTYLLEAAHYCLFHRVVFCTEKSLPGCCAVLVNLGIDSTELIFMRDLI